MRKFALLASLFFVCACGGSGGSGGDPGGTNSNELRNQADLMAVGQNCTGDFVVVNDINVSNDWDGLCDEGFSGALDGGGNTIAFGGGVSGGLFRQIQEGAEVTNLNIEVSAGISGVEIDGANYAGAIAAYADAGSVISNCSATVAGTISANGDFAYAGGLVGSSMGDITGSYAVVRADVVSTGTGDVYAGGLAGYIDGSADNCYAVVDGSISSNTLLGSVSATGGLTGYSSGPVSRCFAYVLNGVKSESDGLCVAGGLTGAAEGDVNESFAVVGGVITVNCPAINGAGGLVGMVREVINVSNSLVMLEAAPVSSSAGGIWGSASAGDPSVADSYAYKADGSTVTQCTEAAALDLREASWWHDTLGLSADNWHSASPDNVPLQKIYPAEDQQALPAWVN